MMMSAIIEASKLINLDKQRVENWELKSGVSGKIGLFLQIRKKWRKVKGQKAVCCARGLALCELLFLSFLRSMMDHNIFFSKKKKKIIV